MSVAIGLTPRLLLLFRKLLQRTVHTPLTRICARPYDAPDFLAAVVQYVVE